jgi:phosphotransferase system  glucose/maltose/N-acetylglucosamine-specific IIC component
VGCGEVLLLFWVCCFFFVLFVFFFFFFFGKQFIEIKKEQTVELPELRRVPREGTRTRERSAFDAEKG